MSLLWSDHTSVRNRKVRLDINRKVVVTIRPGIASLTVNRSRWIVESILGNLMGLGRVNQQLFPNQISI